jgi:hypothetical protein
MSGGWTAVDPVTNKSIPITGTNAGGAVAPYVMPSPMQQDAVGKMRVSQPTSLIDTDFEYGPQPSKWESLNLQNNRPAQYYDPQAPLTVTSVTPSSGTRNITVVGTFVVPAASLIYIQNPTNPLAGGWGFTASGGTNSMTVVMDTLQNTSSNVFNTAGTYVYVGYNYSNSGVALSGSAFTTNGTSTVTVTTTGLHGLSVGSLIYVVGTTSTGTSVNGPQIVTEVSTNNTFTFTNINGTVASLAITNSTGRVNIFARSAGSVESRPYDGGVSFTAGSVGVGQQLIRQTRRYFRYQSGKSVQFSTGTALCPSLFVTSITSSGTTVTVTTRFPHNLSTNCRVLVSGCNPGQYNGNFQVATVPSTTTFTYTASSTPSASPATGFPMRVSPINWAGASNRVGMFDQQNGMFFEYDGQTLFTVWRSSVLQLNGTVTVTQGSATVSGVGTQFSTQLDVGDFIVIRGQTYRVISIFSDTVLYISPEYRGTTISSPSYALVSKTIDTRIPQSQWNLDKCDGTGPSGYRIDLTRMQMLYMDYSWYGAGTIRWGIRATNGQIIWCHQQQNNNVQFEAYLRSGNLPAHYESNGIVGYSGTSDNAAGTFYAPNYPLGMALTNAITETANSITVTSSSNYLPSTGGIISIGTAPNNEFVYYASRSGTTLNGCIRGLPGGIRPRAWAASTTVTCAGITIRNLYGFPTTGGTVRLSGSSASGAITTWAYTNIYSNILYSSSTATSSTYTTFVTSTALLGVEYASPDTAAPLSHWGSSVIMDGGFDDDKSLVFNYGTTSTISINAGTSVPILAIRLAPAVDNGRIGVFGDKETINRGQLQLLDIAVVSSGAVLVNLILNGYTTGFTGGFVSANLGTTVTSSLAQVAVNTSNAATVTGGESVTALYSNGVNQLDLTQVRDLANSILGGGFSNVVPTLASRANVYPDGPDILYVVVTNTTAGAVTALARLNWKEAQA